MAPDDLCLTPGEVAARLRASPGAVRQWIRTGLLAALRDPTGHYWVRESTVRAWRQPVVVERAPAAGNGCAVRAPQVAVVPP